MKTTLSEISDAKAKSEQNKRLIPWLIVVILAITYAILFEWLHRNLGIHGRSFALSYIFFAAWFWGLRGGVSVGLLNIPFIFVLAKTSNIGLPDFPLNHIFTLAIGAVLGLLRDLTSRLKEELFERKRAEEELSRYRDGLEEMVKKRTTELTETNVQLQREISERKLAEEALRKSEEQYRLLAENVTDLIWTMDMDLKFTYASPSIIKLTGYSVEEAMGHIIEEMISPGSLEVAISAFNKGLAEKNNEKQMCWNKSNVLELELNCKDGSTIWTEHKATLLYNEAGQPFGIIGVTRDITERKRFERELLFKDDIIRSSSSMIATCDLEGKMTYVNLSFLKMWGFEDANELLGRHFSEFWEVKDRLDEIMEALQTEGKWFDEIRARRKDGTLFDVQVSAATVYDKEGMPIALTSTSADITERKRAKDALQQSEKRYRTLISKMVNAFALHEVICDETGKPYDYRFLEVNSSFEEMTGLTSGEIVGKTVFDILPQTESYWIDTYGKIALTGGSIHFENYSQELDKYFEVLAYSPKKGQFATVFTDVTDRRRAEEERERLIGELQEALDNVKTLKGLLPICASCKKIRDDKGYWNQIEGYIETHTDVSLSHGLCPECMDKLYGDEDWYNKDSDN